MARGTEDTARGGGGRYRLEVEGSLSAERIEWLEAEALPSAGGRTVLSIEVVDQADLQGRLRRLHDLHLRLISVQRGEGSAEVDR